MGSAILLVIVGAWACVLVPMLLRRHERAVQAQSVHRFSTAMRVLSRRDARTDRRYVVRPRRPHPAAQSLRPPVAAMISHADAGYPAATPGPEAGHTHSGQAPRSRSTQPGQPARTPQPRRPPPPRPSGHALLLARRRRVLVVLLALTGACVLGAVLVGGALAVVAAVLGVLLLTYVGHLRKEAKRALRRSRRRHHSIELANRLAERPLPPERIAVPVRPPAPAPAPAPVQVQVQQPAATGQLPVAPPAAARGRAATARAEVGWQPVPVPPPTYATAAEGPPVVDLTGAGSARAEPPPPVFGLLGERPGLGVDEDLVDDGGRLESAIRRRRAVGD